MANAPCVEVEDVHFGREEVEECSQHVHAYASSSEACVFSDSENRELLPLLSILGKCSQDNTAPAIVVLSARKIAL